MQDRVIPQHFGLTHLECKKWDPQRRRLPYTFHTPSTSSLALSGSASVLSTCKVSRALAGNPIQATSTLSLTPVESRPRCIVLHLNFCSINLDLGRYRLSASAYCIPLELLLVIIFDFISRVSRPETFDQARGRPARPPRPTPRAKIARGHYLDSDLGRYRLPASAICLPELLLMIILDLITRASRPRDLRPRSTTTCTPSASDIPREDCSSSLDLSRRRPRRVLPESDRARKMMSAFDDLIIAWGACDEH
ncbi:hypothetical protein DFH06DRAFT_1347762 [Mycena polygramma]|nr:hypothetical protein DFH06DRAFT_1347762 [Mycena polygramma]